MNYSVIGSFCVCQGANLKEGRDSVMNLELYVNLFVCVEVLRPSQPSGVMSTAISLPNHTFTGQA